MIQFLFGPGEKRATVQYIFVKYVITATGFVVT
jgi:hypothetical protein